MECHLKGITVHYETWGMGHPVILLHGGGPDHRSLVGCMEPVFQGNQGWQRFYPDLPGLGRTRGEDWIRSSDQVLQVVQDFIRAVIPGRHFALVGETYGAYLARGHVYREPTLVDGLMMVCPTIVMDKARRTLPEHAVLVRDEAFLAGLPVEARERFGAFAVVQTARTWQRTQEEVLAGLTVADWAFLSRLEGQGYAFSFDADLGSVPFARPTLILTGRQDSLVGYRDAWEVLEQYPRATFATLDRAGHNLHIEQEGLFGALAGEWLDRVREGLAEAGG